MKLFISIILCSSFVFSEEGNILSGYEPCHYDKSFNSCFKERMRVVINALSDGLPELKIPALDPIKADDLMINANGLKLSLSNTRVHGLRNCEITDFIYNFQDETFKFMFKSNLSLTGKYKVDGKILILPIQGEGDATISAVNTRVQLKGTLKEDNNKKEHLKLFSPTYTYKIERTIFEFKNLFNGNKELSDATHQFANENWQEIMDDLAPPAVKQVVLAYIKAINKFFGSVPLSDLVTGYKKSN